MHVHVPLGKALSPKFLTMCEWEHERVHLAFYREKECKIKVINWLDIDCLGGGDRKNFNPHRSYMYPWDAWISPVTLRKFWMHKVYKDTCHASSIQTSAPPWRGAKNCGRTLERQKALLEYNIISKELGGKYSTVSEIWKWMDGWSAKQIK